MTRLLYRLLMASVCVVASAACVQPIQQVPEDRTLSEVVACDEYLRGQTGELIADILGSDASTTETVENTIRSWFGDTTVNYVIYPSRDHSNLPDRYSIMWSSAGRDYVAEIDQGVFATITYGIADDAAKPSLATVLSCHGEPNSLLRWRFGPVAHGALIPSVYLLYPDTGVVVIGSQVIEPLFNQYSEMPAPSGLPLENVIFTKESSPVELLALSYFRDIDHPTTSSQREWFEENLEVWRGELDGPYVESAFPF